MTIIVGIVTEAAVWMGADQLLVNGLADVLATDDIKVTPSGQLLIGVAGAQRVANLVNQIGWTLPPEEQLLPWLVRAWVPELRRVLRDGGALRMEDGRESMDSEVLVGHAGSPRLCYVNGDFSISPLGWWGACGSGAPWASARLGAYEIAPEEPEALLLEALRAAARHHTHIRPPFRLCSTSGFERIVRE